MDQERYQRELQKLREQIDSLNAVFQQSMGSLNEQLQVLESAISQPNLESANAIKPNDEAKVAEAVALTPDLHWKKTIIADYAKPELKIQVSDNLLAESAPKVVHEATNNGLSLLPTEQSKAEPGADFSARLEKQLDEAPILGGLDHLELVKRCDDTLLAVSDKTVEASAEVEPPSTKPRPTKIPVKPIPAKAQQPANSSALPNVKPAKVHEPAKPSWLALFLGSLFSFIFGPINNLVLKALELYRHYRDQGKAPVFLMTTAGIITLLFGFGYLLQYSFVYLLSPPVKMLLCVVAGAGFVGIGHKLSSSRNYLRDYASSLIALGFVTEFLVIYFAADMYRMIGITAALIFYLINSALAMYMAVKHETRVVAVVTLVGGLFVPAFGEHAVVAPITYCPYVLLICVGSLYLSRAIRWKELSVLTLFSYSAATQLFVNASHQISPSAYAIYSVIAFSAFCFDALWRDGKIKTDLHRYDLLTSVANMSFFIWASYDVLAGTVLLNAIYSVLAALFIGLMYLNRDIKESAAILALQAAVFSGAAVAAVLGGEVWSLFFALEALALMVVGCVYQNAWIRNEGYFALVIAIAQLIALLLGAFGSHEMRLFSSSWVSLLACSVSVWASHRVLVRYQEHLLPYEFQLTSLLSQLVNVAISVSILTTAYLVDFYWVYVLCFVPMFIILYRTKSDYSIYAELFALGHAVLALKGLEYGIESSMSFKFSLQPWWAKVLRVETLLSLWLISKFYATFMVDKGFKVLAEIPRIIFFALLPVVLASYVWRHSPDFMMAGFWLSALFSLVLLKRISNDLYKYEMTVFVALALLSCKLIFAEQIPLLAAAVGVAAGCGFFVILLRLGHAFNKRQLRISELAAFFPIAFHYFSFALLLAVFKLTDSLALASAAVCFLNLYYCYGKPVMTPIRNQLLQFYVVIALSSWFIASGASISAGAATGELVLAYSPIVLMVACFHKAGGRARLLQRGQAQLWVLHLMIIVAYTTFLQKAVGNGFNPYVSIALIIQASIALMLTLKHRLYFNAAKLSIAIFALAAFKIFVFDLKESSMFEKMIAMIGIGAVLLISGYVYQRLKLQFDAKRQLSED